MYYHGRAESFNGGVVDSRNFDRAAWAVKQIGPAVRSSTAGPQFTEE